MLFTHFGGCITVSEKSVSSFLLVGKTANVRGFAPKVRF